MSRFRSLFTSKSFVAILVGLFDRTRANLEVRGELAGREGGSDVRRLVRGALVLGTRCDVD